MKPTISVIIPNFNNGKYLVECIDSVFSQTYQPIECIVVDDESTDNSIEIIKKLSLKYPQLRYFQQINSGPSVARNLGLKNANGEYIAMLDADDYWSKDKLANQISVISTISDNKHIITSHNNYFNDEYKYFDLNKPIYPPYTIYDAFSRNIAIGSCSSILFPKKLFLDIGGYNPMLRVSEDQDFHFRAILAGYQFHHSYNTDVHIRWHEGNTTKNAIKNIYFNLLAFEIQCNQLKQLDLNTKNRKQFSIALNGKLGNIFYWANEINRNDLKNYIKAILKRELGLRMYYKHKIFSLILSILKQ